MHAKCKQLLEKIDELYPVYLDVWEDICRIESPTSDKAGVDAVGRYVCAIAEKHAWDIKIHNEEISGDAISITLNPDSHAKSVVFSAHMDTVHPKGSFGENVTRRDGEKLYAPGAVDCKGGIAVALLVMHALEEIGFTKRPVKLILQSDEEIGSRTSEKRTVKFMADEAKGALAFFNLEGSSTGYAIVTRKGIAYFTFNVSGVEAHAAVCAKNGANAIAEAAHKIIEIEKFKDHKGITCNCGVIKGGSVPNTVPGGCEFCVNVRYANSEQLEFITKEIKRIADTVYIPGCKTEVVKTGMRVAMEPEERNYELLEKINKIYEENGFSRLLPGHSNGGSDASDMTSYGIPSLDSLSVTGGNIHSSGEFGLLESLRESAKRMALAAQNIE